MKSDGAVGIRLDVGPHDMLHIPIHYPLALADAYDRPAAEVLRRIRGNLGRAITSARRLQSALDAEKATAALVCRSNDIAFIVDGGLRIRDANQPALEAFRQGDLILCVRDRITIRHGKADRWLTQLAARLSRGRPADSVARIFRMGDRAIHISVTTIPASATVAPISTSDRLALVLVQNLRTPSNSKGISQLAAAFGLTPAEKRLAVLLAEERTLNQAADELQISRGTARQRLKAIFEKTDTHRQSQLVALMARLD